MLENWTWLGAELQLLELLMGRARQVESLGFKKNPIYLSGELPQLQLLPGEFTPATRTGLGVMVVFRASSEGGGPQEEVTDYSGSQLPLC